MLKASVNDHGYTTNNNALSILVDKPVGQYHSYFF